jgi:hypothetical protein
MMDEYKNLSRLLSGELDAQEEADLKAKIAANPELAAKWAQMQALPSLLQSLPRELPPPLLETQKTSYKPLYLAGLALAAGLFLWMLWPESQPDRVLLSGTEWVSGQALVLAGDVQVKIDGVAEISVEPAPGWQRVVGAEDKMNQSHIVAALAGSLVTVSVLEGRAWFLGDTPIAIEAGETHSLQSKGKAVEPEPVKQQEVASEVATLKQEVARLEREKAVIAARLKQQEGSPEPWPASVPKMYEPENFEEFLEGRIQALPDAEILAIDCEEYPCVALVESHSQEPDWEDKLAWLHDNLEEAGFGDHLRVMGLASESRNQDGPLKLYAFAVSPADLPESAQARLQYRASGALKELSE